MLKAPVTALCLLEDGAKCVFGAGRCIQTFDLNTKSVNGSLKPILNERSKVSQIINSNGAIFVSGGRQLCKVSLNFEILIQRQFLDKIAHVSAIGEYILVVLAHGQVHLLEPDNLSSIYVYYLENDNLIYSASVFERNDTIYIAYGTVFHGIEICMIPSEKGEHFLKAKGRLCGHEGSIYSLALNEDSSFLASVSDDRTLRIWKLGELFDKEGIFDLSASTVTAVGHKSRVWRVLWHNESILTSAEDSTIRIWDISGACVQVLQGHLGLNIWSIAIKNDMIVSGGDDCSVRLWKMSNMDNLKPVPLVFSKEEKTEPKSFEVSLSSDKNVVLFSDGSFTGVDSKIPQSEISGYAMLKFYENEQILLVGNLKGKLFLEKGSVVKSIDCGFISKVSFLQSHIDGDFSYCLVQSGDRNTAFIKINVESLEYSVLNAGFFKDVAVVTFNCLPNGQFIAGSRDGRIFIFHIHHDALKMLTCQPYCKEAISSVALLSKDLYIASSRDGFVHVMRLTSEEMTSIWKSKISVGWLEQVNVVDGRVYIAGYEGSNFILWSSLVPSDQNSSMQFTEVFRTITGGAHRYWQLKFYEDRFVFAFLRQGQIFYYSQEYHLQSRMETIVSGLHGAEIRSVTCSEEFVITGCENGLLGFSMMDEHGTLGNMSTVKAHQYGIKSIHSVKDKLFVAGSGELLSCWQFDSSTTHPLLLHFAPKTSECKEVRIMDVHALEISDDEYLIVIACSDSFVRVFSYNNDEGFTFLAEFEAHPEHCALKCRFLTDMYESIFVISGGTDGDLSLLEYSVDDNSLCFLMAERCHQSGINALEVYKDTYIATGGDDGKICIFNFEWGGTILFLFNLWEAHHSTISGLAWIDDKTLISTSVDQCLKVWNVTFDSLKPARPPINSQIADINSMILLSNYAIVTGVGFETLRIN